jgi:hypothetical protein
VTGPGPIEGGEGGGIAVLSEEGTGEAAVDVSPLGESRRRPLGRGERGSVLFDDRHAVAIILFGGFPLRLHLVEPPEGPERPPLVVELSQASGKLQSPIQDGVRSGPATGLHVKESSLEKGVGEEVLIRFGTGMATDGRVEAVRPVKLVQVAEAFGERHRGAGVSFGSRFREGTSPLSETTRPANCAAVVVSVQGLLQQRISLHRQQAGFLGRVRRRRERGPVEGARGPTVEVAGGSVVLGSLVENTDVDEVLNTLARVGGGSGLVGPKVGMKRRGQVPAQKMEIASMLVKGRLNSFPDRPSRIRGEKRLLKMGQCIKKRVVGL